LHPGEGDHVTDYPDLYADGFSITAGPFGVTLTLTRTVPTGEPGAHEEPIEIVGRVRLSPALAKAVADAFQQVAAAAAQAGQQTGTTVTH
jgi:hypothetical protein